MAETGGLPIRLPVTDDDDDTHDGAETGAEARAKTHPSLQVAASFDSETDSGYFNLTLAPLHAIQTEELSLKPRGDTGEDPDLISDTFHEKPTFEVADDSDFEILPDDDDAGEEVPGKRIGGTKPILRRRKSAPDSKSAALASPPRSPVNTPPQSPPRSPTTPTRRLLDRLAAPLSPKQRGGWRGSQHQHHDDSDVPAPGELKDGKIKSHRRFQTSADGFALRSPLQGPFRAIRARAKAAYKGTDNSTAPSVEQSVSPDDLDKEESSSSEEEEMSLEADEISSDEDLSIFEDDAHGPEVEVDFSSIPPMPISFLELPPDLYDYLDPELVKNISDQQISTYAYEHHMLVKGLLQLLAERDIVGVEGDIHDSSNVIKMGPLKKKTSRGLWSVKYVEIRRGNLSYFADNLSQHGSAAARKTIHLRKRNCRCEPAEETNANSDTFVFELLVEGGPKKVWMAKSEEERQGWIRAINQAMIGETEGSQDAPVDLSMYKTAIAAYQSVQTSLKQVQTRGEYLVAVDSLLYRKTASSALRVPMTWVREEVIKREESQRDVDSIHVRFKSAISENWKFLSSTSVDINGCLIAADTAYSAERVIGTLSRCILEFDKVDDSAESMLTVKRSKKDAFMTEVEAVSYARSILLGALRSDSNGDVLAAVQNLVQNESLARVEFEKSEPLHIDVSFAGDDFFSEREQQPYDMSGWLMTKPKRGKAWKRRFFVVSEGVLSFFAEAEPRPYGLRGQIVLAKCVMKSTDDETLSIEWNEGEERSLQFDDRGSLLKWRSVLERAADQEGPSAPRDPPPERKRGKRNSIVSNVKPIKAATDTGVKVGIRAMKAMQGAKNAGMKKIKNASGVIARGIRQRGRHAESDERRASAQAMLMMSTRGLSDVKNQKRDPTVQAVTELNSVFRVMPVPSSEDAEPLLIIRVRLYQAFLMSGGANGRMSRGDELIEMEFVGLEDGDHEFLEAPTSL